MAIISTPKASEGMSRRAFLSLFSRSVASQGLEPTSGALAVMTSTSAKSRNAITQPSAPLPAAGEHAPPVSPEAARRLAYFRAGAAAAATSDPEIGIA